MRYFVIALILMGVVALAHRSVAEYLEPDDDSSYPGNYLEEILQPQPKRSPQIFAFRRGCVQRGSSCDHRPNDCCYSSSCRCNFWGSNCRCQRRGLFQKWG